MKELNLYSSGRSGSKGENDNKALRLLNVNFFAKE